MGVSHLHDARQPGYGNGARLGEIRLLGDIERRAVFLPVHSGFYRRQAEQILRVFALSCLFCGAGFNSDRIDYPRYAADVVRENYRCRPSFPSLHSIRLPAGYLERRIIKKALPADPQYR